VTVDKYLLKKMKFLVVMGHHLGENGYMKILRDIEVPEGLCGLAMHPSYPVTA
jgi:hypothetical protein